MTGTRTDEIVRLTAIGWTQRQIANDLGVSESTVKRQRAAHRDRITQLRDQAAEDAAAVIGSLVPKALRRLAELIDSPNDPVALGASKFVVDAALRWREQTEVERRLQALEHTSNGGDDDWHW